MSGSTRGTAFGDRARARMMSRQQPEEPLPETHPALSSDAEGHYIRLRDAAAHLTIQDLPLALAYAEHAADLDMAREQLRDLSRLDLSDTSAVILTHWRVTYQQAATQRTKLLELLGLKATDRAKIKDQLSFADQGHDDF